MRGSSSFSTNREGQGAAYGMSFVRSNGDVTLTGASVDISVSSTTSSGPVTAFLVEGSGLFHYAINSDQIKISSSAPNAQARALDLKLVGLTLGNGASSVIDISAKSDKSGTAAVYLNDSGSVLKLKGNTTISGDFYPNAGTVNFQGNTTINGGFYLNAGTVNLQGDTTINGTLDLAAGMVNVEKGNLVLKGDPSTFQSVDSTTNFAPGTGYVTNLSDLYLNTGTINFMLNLS